MISKVIGVSVCASSFLYTFYILCNLMYFLSCHNDNYKTMVRSKTEDILIASTLWTLLVDACLLSGFMLQHSLMASDFLKNFYTKWNIQDLERSIYNAATASALHVLLKNWQPVPWVSIWNVDTVYNNKLWLTFTAFHVLGWFVVYSGCLMMDISELAGLKQVYYKLSARPPPMVVKSRELRRYYAHMRHPSFTGFLAILWIHPFMTIDRLLLASLLTIYMVLMWTIDRRDCSYHEDVIRLKKRQLS